MNRGRLAALVAFASFVALGLPEAVVATAWPDMAADLDRSIGDLQWLLVSYTAGYLLSSAPAGAAVSRVGVRVTASGGLAVAMVGLTLYALGPTFPVVVLAGFLVGCGAGPLDTALNVWAGTRGPRVMNLLHAFFGVGTTLGPPLAVAAAALSTWRGAYWALVAVDAVLLVAVWSIGPDHRPPPAEDHPSERTNGAFGSATALILGTFAIYVAVEATAGAWGVSFLTDQHDLSHSAAGFAIAGYWGALTIGRVALGLFGSTVRPRRVLVSGSVGSIVACGLIAVGGRGGAVVGLILLGLCLAGIFPALMLLTPEMVGPSRAPLVVGWSLSASGISFGLAAIAVGQQVDRAGLGVVPANLLLGSALLAVLVAVLVRRPALDRTRPSSATFG
ncbi:MAG: MFS transporter [Acidimicrobiales bacterium]